MRLYFIRHTETDCNVRHAYYGHLDVPINENGKKQAQILANQLKNVHFDRVYASDLCRVAQTLEIVLKENISVAENKTAIKCPEIREMNFGQWEGCNYREVVEKWPDNYKAWSDDWKYTAPEGGESFAAFYNRVKQGFEQIMEDASASGMDDKTILIAAHNGSLRVLFAVMMGLDMDGTWHFNFEQDAYNIVDFECDNFTVRKINSREIL